MKNRIAYFVCVLMSAALLSTGCGNTNTNLNNSTIVTASTAAATTTNESTGNASEWSMSTTQENNENSSTANTVELSASTAVESGEDASFSATMLDVGQGLSVLIQSDGQNMLYDGGNRSHSSYVVAYLQQHGVDHLDYMVASHYDEDHIAGLVGVLNTATVDTIICPDYETDSKIYQSFINGEEKSGAKVEHPDADTEYMLGNAKIDILHDDPSMNGENNRSIAVKVTYGTFSMILTGDSEEEAEDAMISSGEDLHADLYVAGHHGSSSSSSQKFLQAVSPSYAWISCGLGNSYGHPHKETMQKFQNDGIQIFRTDKQGEVTVYSNGSSYWFSTTPSDDWKSGNEESGTQDAQSKNTQPAKESANNSAVSENTTETGYVLNTHTMKFHRPDCDAVQKMSSSNREDSSLSREELIAEGYSPCGLCKP